MNKLLFTTTSTAIGLALSLAWTPVHAQQQQQADRGKIDIETWATAQDELMNGWTAEWLYDQPVYDIKGEDVGEVEEIFIGTDGRIEAIIVEAGGFLDIGDIHLRVPWRDVTFTNDRRIVVDVNEDNLPDFDVTTPDPEPGPRAFRANELIGDYANLEDAPTFGYVSDVVFDMDGEVTAVIVNPRYGYGARYGYPYGYYAYPYYGYAPGAPAYDLPYTAEEVGALRPMDYGAFGVEAEDEGQVMTRGAGGQPQQQ